MHHTSLSAKVGVHESLDDTRRRQLRSRKSSSVARKTAGHAAPSGRVHDSNEVVQFEEAPTPNGVNLFMREVTPSGPLPPGEDRRLADRRAHRVGDARAAAGRTSIPACRRTIEREAAADDASIEEPSASEKARHAEMRVSEADSLLIASEQRAVESKFELLGYSTDSALMHMWNRRKEQQSALDEAIVQSMATEKSERAKRRYDLVEALRGSSARPFRQLKLEEHEE